MLIEAGCKEKNWIKDEQDIASEYTWTALNGSRLLAKGACIVKGYKKYLVPEKGITKVHSTIEYQEMGSVIANEQSVSIDFTLTLVWLDPHIRANQEDLKHDSLALSPRAIKMIWTPDMHIWNRASFKAEPEWRTLISCKILPLHETSKLEGGKETTKTGIEMRYEVKATVLCNFKHSNYPMDTQNCNILFGSSSSGAIFVLHDTHRKQNDTIRYEAVDFDVSISFFDNKTMNGNSVVEIAITMDRSTISFILKYYIPCNAIVIVSLIGFIIPVSAIPGRVALLVTQFLTLINLFIYQMVRKYSQMGKALNFFANKSKRLNFANKILFL